MCPGRAHEEADERGGAAARRDRRACEQARTTPEVSTRAREGVCAAASARRSFARNEAREGQSDAIRSELRAPSSGRSSTPEAPATREAVWAAPDHGRGPRRRRSPRVRRERCDGTLGARSLRRGRIPVRRGHLIAGGPRDPRRRHWTRGSRHGDRTHRAGLGRHGGRALDRGARTLSLDGQSTTLSVTLSYATVGS